MHKLTYIKPEPGMLFKHQNGNVYKVIDPEVWDGKHDEMGVLHENVATLKRYFRSVENFTGLHSNGKPRFEYLGK